MKRDLNVPHEITKVTRFGRVKGLLHYAISQLSTIAYRARNWCNKEISFIRDF